MESWRGLRPIVQSEHPDNDICHRPGQRQSPYSLSESVPLDSCVVKLSSECRPHIGDSAGKLDGPLWNTF
jgi:hypothetical protein